MQGMDSATLQSCQITGWLTYSVHVAEVPGVNLKEIAPMRYCFDLPDGNSLLCEANPHRANLSQSLGRDPKGLLCVLRWNYGLVARTWSFAGSSWTRPQWPKAGLCA